MGHYRTRVEADFILRHLPAAAQSVLDVGGGAGRLGSVLHAQGHRVTVLDKNSQALELAKEKGLANAVVCNILDFDGSGFDAVVCMEVLEYFKDCAPVIAKCASFARPGGVFVFCIINSGSWRFKLQQLQKNHSGAQAYSQPEVARILSQHGFEILEQRGFQWCLARTGSDSPMVTVSAVIEKTLGLNRWLAQSPWLLYACRKIK